MERERERETDMKMWRVSSASSECFGQFLAVHKNAQIRDAPKPRQGRSPNAMTTFAALAHVADEGRAAARLLEKFQAIVEECGGKLEKVHRVDAFFGGLCIWKAVEQS